MPAIVFPAQYRAKRKPLPGGVPPTLLALHHRQGKLPSMQLTTPIPSTANKVAAITASFWVAKIIATTLGETAGDFIAHTLGLGYVVGFGITNVLLIVALAAQIRANAFHPFFFWAAIVATTTAGTEVSDMMDRNVRFGYILGSTVLFTGLVLTLALWYMRKRSLSVEPIVSKESELFFWIAVVFSNSLGTAFGDTLIDPIGMSFIQGALVCSPS